MKIARAGSLFEVVAVSAAIANQVRQYARYVTSDPGYRIIASTAEEVKFPLASDRNVRASRRTPVIW